MPVPHWPCRVRPLVVVAVSGAATSCARCVGRASLLSLINKACYVMGVPWTHI